MSEIPEVDVPAAKKALEGGKTLFVDIRDTESFTAGHIPGAVLVNDGNVEEFVKSTARDKELIVYCFHGINSVGGTAYFLGQGFKTVHSLQGGFEAWSGSGPVDRP